MSNETLRTFMIQAWQLSHGLSKMWTETRWALYVCPCPYNNNVTPLDEGER
jgi:hypothetical protein